MSLYKELEHISDRLLTVSNSFKAYMSPYVNTPDSIGVIHNGFDDKRFKPVPHENAVPQLITVCRLVPAKGLDILLQACAELKRKGYDYVLHIIGDGPSRQELEEMAKTLGIYQETIFTATRCIRRSSCRSLISLSCLREQRRSDRCSRKLRSAVLPW